MNNSSINVNKFIKVAREKNVTYPNSNIYKYIYEKSTFIVENMNKKDMSEKVLKTQDQMGIATMKDIENTDPEFAKQIYDFLDQIDSLNK